MVVKDNKIFIDLFERLANQIEAIYLNAQAEGDKKTATVTQFRLKAIKNVVSIFKKLDFKITSSDDLKGINGIGKRTLERVDEIIRTGHLAELDVVPVTDKQAVINSIQELETVIGIGKSTAKQLILKYKIKSVDELKKAVSDGTFKASNTIKLGLKYYGIVQSNIPRAEITSTSKYLQKIASKIDKNLKIMVCGSYRRKRPTSGDIDLLLYHPSIITMDQINGSNMNNSPQYLGMFVGDLERNKFILDSITNVDPKIIYMGFSKLGSNPVRRIDIKYIPYESLPTAMLHFTGPYELNRHMRKEAIKRGMILNEYGLFIEKPNGKKTRVRIESEKDVFEILGMNYLTPKQRDDFMG